MKNVLPFPKLFQKEIKKAIDLLQSAGCTEIYIFGSLAEGNFSNDSDIDIAVKGLPDHLFFKISGKLMHLLEKPFDLIQLDDEQSDFSRHIQKNGNLIRVA